MSNDPSALGRLYLDATLRIFERQKRLADRAIAQVPPEMLHRQRSPVGNSISVIMQHLAGNMRSRWTDFLDADGEKDWRERDLEFTEGSLKGVALTAAWEEGWRTLFATIQSLAPEDLERMIEIRGEAQPALAAIQRQFDHYAYHVGQIVELAREIAGDDWDTLSVPRGGSKAFTERMRASDGKQGGYWAKRPAPPPAEDDTTG